MDAKRCVPLGREPAAAPKRQSRIGEDGEGARGPAGVTSLGREQARGYGAEVPLRREAAAPPKRTPGAASEQTVHSGKKTPEPELPKEQAVPEMPKRSKKETLETKPPQEQAPLIEYAVPQIPTHAVDEIPVTSVLTNREIPFREAFTEEEGAKDAVSAGHEPANPPLPQTRYIPIREEGGAESGKSPAVQRLVPWRGSRAGGFEPLLREMIQKALANWRYYRSLGKKVGGVPAKTFADLAADEWQCAKRLAAAHFLATGERYWPEETAEVDLPAYLVALRERFHAEQQDEAWYGEAVGECRDDCLREIFEEAAGQSRRHARQLLLLAEQL